MPNESLGKTLFVATSVCLVCSVLVSTAAVSLKDRQQKNQRMDMIRNLLAVGGVDAGPNESMSIFGKRFQPVLVDLASGQLSGKVSPQELEAGSVTVASRSNRQSIKLPPGEDEAGIGRVPKKLTAYWVLDEKGAQEKLILPFYGKGLWSTMYGFLALSTADFSSIRGLTFFEHGETPGLGGEVDNPSWKEAWHTKKLLDPQSRYALEVLKGRVDPRAAGAENRVDGLSGATLTTRGVDRMLHFWLAGPHGFYPLLQSLRNANREIHP